MAVPPLSGLGSFSEIDLEDTRILIVPHQVMLHAGLSDQFTAMFVSPHLFCKQFLKPFLAVMLAILGVIGHRSVR